MDAAVESGVKLRTEVDVNEVDVENTALVLEGGERISADLIILSDGVQSIVRPSVIDSPKFCPYQATGHNCFWFMVSMSTQQKDEVIATFVVGDCHMFSWKGNDKQILEYPVDFDGQFNVTCTDPRELSDREVSDNDSAVAVGKSSS